MLRATSVALLLASLVGCGPPGVWRGMSPDHLRVFDVAEDDGRACVTFEDEAERCFDGISLSRFVFSPDSRSVAYPVQQDGGWVVVRDGVPGPVEDGVGELVFNPDGTRLAYTASRGGRWHVVVDGETSVPYDSLFAGTLQFDPSGERLAYAAFRRGQAVAVVDGLEGPPVDGIAQLRFSPDGRRVGYVGRFGDRAALVVDGSAGPMHDLIASYVFAPGSEDVAYVAGEGTAWWVMGPEGRQGPYPDVRGLGFRPDGALYFIAVDGEGERLVNGALTGPVFESVDPPAFSARGHRWGYVAHDSASSTVIMDGEIVDAQAWAGDLIFNETGDRWAYVIHRGDSDVVMHDGGVDVLDMVVDGTLQFLPEQDVWACLAGDFDSRDLFVRVEGLDEARPFSWSDFSGVVGSRSGAPLEGTASLEALRAWVRAEARIMLGISE